MRDGEDPICHDQTRVPWPSLNLSKINCMKPKFGANLWLCYMDTDSLVYNIKTDDFYEHIIGKVKARFDMSDYSHSRNLPMGVNKKVIGLMKDRLGGKIMTEFVTLRPKLYAYKTLSGSVGQEVHHEEEVRLQGLQAVLISRSESV